MIDAADPICGLLIDEGFFIAGTIVAASVNILGKIGRQSRHALPVGGRQNEEEILPWDTIDVGVTKAFFLRERKQAYAGKVTPDCRSGCSGCGASKLLKEVGCDA